MGNPNTHDTGHKFGIQGPQDNADPHIARQAALREAAEFGMIGLLNTGAGGDPNAPTGPRGVVKTRSETTRLSARSGNMWGDTIGDSFGAGGLLGLSGVGEGGGGRGEGIGLGNIGTIGHGAGTGTGQGFGNGHGRLGGAHQTRSPSLRQGTTTVNGRLPPEVIQRIVRQNFGRFRLCYENGLRTNPNLSGRVAVKFVIDRFGRRIDGLGRRLGISRIRASCSASFAASGTSASRSSEGGHRHGRVSDHLQPGRLRVARSTVTCS